MVHAYFSFLNYQHSMSDSVTKNLNHCLWMKARTYSLHWQPWSNLWSKRIPQTQTLLEGLFPLSRNFLLFHLSCHHDFSSTHREFYLYRNIFTCGGVLSEKTDSKLPKLIHQLKVQSVLHMIRLIKFGIIRTYMEKSPNKCVLLIFSSH